MKVDLSIPLTLKELIRAFKISSGNMINVFVVGPCSLEVEHKTNYLKLSGWIPCELTISTCSAVCFHSINFAASALIYKRFINTALHQLTETIVYYKKVIYELFRFTTS